MLPLIAVSSWGFVSLTKRLVSPFKQMAKSSVHDSVGVPLKPLPLGSPRAQFDSSPVTQVPLFGMQQSCAELSRLKHRGWVYIIPCVSRYTANLFLSVYLHTALHPLYIAWRALGLAWLLCRTQSLYSLLCPPTGHA